MKKDPQLEPLLLGQLVEAIGSDRFGALAFDLVAHCPGADHIVVYCVGGGYTGEQIQGLFTEGRLSKRVANTLNQRYLERYYMLDKNLGTLHGVGVDAPAVLRMDPQDIASPTYKHYFYGRTGLCDKLSIVSRRQGRLLLCNLYRLAASGRFDERQMVRAQQLAPVLTACVWRHMACLDGVLADAGPRPADRVVAQAETRRDLCREPGAEPSVESNSARLLLRRLSNRETDVCRRLLAGASNEAAALDLGISVHTVRTLRKRLYKKLQVNSLGDLYARYLSAMAGQVSGGA